MPTFLPNDNPLSYLGVRPENPADTIIASRAPASTDKKPIGTNWINKVTGNYYLLVKYASGVPTWQLIGGATVEVETLTGDTGGALSPTAGNINIIGGTGGVTVAGSGSTLTINVPGSGLATVTIAGTTQTAVIDTRYIPLNAGLTTITLPAVFAVGDVIIVTGFGTGGWRLVAAAGDTIHTSGGDAAAAVGLNSTNRYDSISLVCAVANSDWVAEAIDGVLTIT